METPSSKFIFPPSLFPRRRSLSLKSLHRRLRWRGFLLRCRSGGGAGAGFGGGRFGRRNVADRPRAPAQEPPVVANRSPDERTGAGDHLTALGPVRDVRHAGEA